MDYTAYDKDVAGVCGEWREGRLTTPAAGAALLEAVVRRGVVGAQTRQLRGLGREDREDVVARVHWDLHRVLAASPHPDLPGLYQSGRAGRWLAKTITNRVAKHAARARRAASRAGAAIGDPDALACPGAGWAGTDGSWAQDLESGLRHMLKGPKNPARAAWQRALAGARAVGGLPATVRPGPPARRRLARLAAADPSALAAALGAVARGEQPAGPAGALFARWDPDSAARVLGHGPPQGRDQRVGAIFVPYAGPMPQVPPYNLNRLRGRLGALSREPGWRAVTDRLLDAWRAAETVGETAAGLDADPALTAAGAGALAAMPGLADTAALWPGAPLGPSPARVWARVGGEWLAACRVADADTLEARGRTHKTPRRPRRRPAGPAG
jgi:hypothetical protein